MSARALQVRLTCTRHAAPLAVVDGLPGGGAELTPGQLRDLAAALVRVAEDAEARPTLHRGKPRPPQVREYAVGASS